MWHALLIEKPHFRVQRFFNLFALFHLHRLIYRYNDFENAVCVVVVCDFFISHHTLILRPISAYDSAAAAACRLHAMFRTALYVNVVVRIACAYFMLLHIDTRQFRRDLIQVIRANANIPHTS